MRRSADRMELSAYTLIVTRYHDRDRRTQQHAISESLDALPAVPCKHCSCGQGSLLLLLSLGNCVCVLQTINFNAIPYAVRVEGGATLVFTNVQLFNLAPAPAYSYSSSTLWRSTGRGTTSWPSVGLAPNATVGLQY
jgi:hypothetical protein